MDAGDELMAVWGSPSVLTALMLSPRVDDEDDGDEKGLITITERFDCDIDERKEEDKASILMKSDFFFPLPYK